MINYWPLLGIAVVVAGFALRYNPALVVVIAGLVSGLAAGKSPGELLALLGNAFLNYRTLLLLYAVTLPAIGVLERAGLRERARTWILGFARLTLAGLLIAYLVVRQGLAMIGLTQVAGQAQTVRPLIAPMAEATARRKLALDPEARERVRAIAAATDNVGLFFGEDVFFAFSAVLFIQGIYKDHGIALDPLSIGLWALPTAVAAFVIHAVRILIFERRLARTLPEARPGEAPTAPPPREAG